MRDESFIVQADSDVITDHSDSVAYMFKDDTGPDRYLAAKSRLERLIIGLRGRIRELELSIAEIEGIAFVATNGSAFGDLEYVSRIASETLQESEQGDGK